MKNFIYKIPRIFKDKSELTLDTKKFYRPPIMKGLTRALQPNPQFMLVCGRIYKYTQAAAVILWVNDVIRFLSQAILLVKSSMKQNKIIVNSINNATSTWNRMVSNISITNTIYIHKNLSTVLNIMGLLYCTSYLFWPTNIMVRRTRLLTTTLQWIQRKQMQFHLFSYNEVF